MTAACFVARVLWFLVGVLLCPFALMGWALVTCVIVLCDFNVPEAAENRIQNLWADFPWFWKVWTL